MVRLSFAVLFAVTSTLTGGNAVPTGSTDVIISLYGAGIITQQAFDNLPMCDNILSSNTTHGLHRTLCLDPESRHTNLASPHSLGLLSRRDNDNGNTTLTPQTDLPFRSENVKGDWIGGSMTQFCFRDGPTPNTKDTEKLCDELPDTYIVGRNKNKKKSQQEGDCFCEKFHHGTAWFKLCNCDRCDRLEVKAGLKDMCKETNQMCAVKGFSSGYMKLDSQNGLLVQYNTNKTEARSGKLDPDPIRSRPELANSTCLSGDRFKNYYNDYTGEVVQCWRPWWTAWTLERCHDYSADGSHNYFTNRFAHNFDGALEYFGV